MGFASRILTQSLGSVLWRAHGDECTIRRGESTVKCLVQFDQRAQPVPFTGEVSVSGPDGSVALIKKTISIPRVGEVIIEANGTEHRILQLRDLGYAWECRCETTITDS